MPAKFREVTPYSGVDESLASGAAGMVIAVKGSNQVKLMGGAKLDVVCSDTTKSLVVVHEITDAHQLKLANQQNPAAGPFRLFKVTAKGVPGMDKVTVNAFPKGKTKNPEATLKILVLRPRQVTISLRAVQTYNPADKKPANYSKLPFDPNKLRDEMNAIWTPQTNITFALGNLAPAPLKSLSHAALGADIKDAALIKELGALKDGQNFTSFFVYRAFNGNERPRGVTDEQVGVALIGDDRTGRTLSHEAGHYLGSHSSDGKFTIAFGHPGTGDELMHDGGSGLKIPYSLVPTFNNGYTSKP